MIRKFNKKIIKTIFKSTKGKDSLLKWMFNILERDPLAFAYNNIGILNYKNEFESGESYLIFKILPQYLSPKEEFVFFDVGANIGQYSRKLASVYKTSAIFSFEPHHGTYELLCENVKDFSYIRPVNVGLGATDRQAELYTYSNKSNSLHASLYKDVFLDLHKTKDLNKILIELKSLDGFCKKNEIDCIDFLKIDTEGNELETLRGGMQMINEAKIKMIQFEFNEMNIISRVFLKDFYQILSNFNMFRLHEKKLIPLFEYESRNEIFQFQNILAIHKDLKTV